MPFKKFEEFVILEYFDKNNKQQFIDLGEIVNLTPHCAEYRSELKQCETDMYEIQFLFK